jgi:hypothetical protein
VLATLSSTRTDNLIDSGEGGAAALTSGYHLAFWIGAALVGAAIAVAVIVFEPKDRQEGAATEPAPREEAYSEAA